MIVEKILIEHYKISAFDKEAEIKVCIQKGAHENCILIVEVVSLFAC